MPGDPRRALREAFAEEIDEAAASLERCVVILADPPSSDAARDAIAEVYRLVHGVKGAARAAGFPDLERRYHDLESRLAPLRGAPSAASDVGTMALDALRFLTEASARLPSPSLRPEGDVAPAPAPAPELLRVGVARVDELHGMLEQVQSAASALDSVAPGDEMDGLDAVLRELERAERQARGRDPDDPLPRAVDVATGRIQALRDHLAERTAAAGDARRRLRAAVATAAAQVRRLRLVEVATLRPSLELAFDDLARRLGRKARLEVEDRGAEMDRRVLDALREPLLHLLRNALDHGIEPPDVREAQGKPPVATVRIVFDAGAHDMTIVVTDDGSGIDRAAVVARAAALGLDPDPRDALGLIFEHGFTTRSEATRVSGRGLGLDVVRQRIARLQGRVSVTSRPSEGTRFELNVPLDLTVLRGVLVRVGESHFVFATTTVERLVRAGPDDVTSTLGKRFLTQGGERLPLVDLGLLFKLTKGGAPLGREKQPCLVVAAADRRVALLAGALLDERDFLVRPLPARIRRVPFVQAAAPLPNGQLAFVVDVAELAERARPSAAVETARAEQRRVLVVDDSVTTRQLERVLLEAAGFDVSLAPDGAAAWDLLSSGLRIDLIVSDIEMPKMDGFQLLARVRATRATAAIPVMLVTALESAADRQRALDLGASAYVLKRSFDQGEFLAALESLL